MPYPYVLLVDIVVESGNGIGNDCGGSRFGDSERLCYRGVNPYSLCTFIEIPFKVSPLFCRLNHCRIGFGSIHEHTVADRILCKVSSEVKVCFKVFVGKQSVYAFLEHHLCKFAVSFCLVLVERQYLIVLTLFKHSLYLFVRRHIKVFYLCRYLFLFLCTLACTVFLLIKGFLFLCI